MKIGNSEGIPILGTMVRINVVGPEIDEYFAFLEKVRIQNGLLPCCATSRAESYGSLGVTIEEQMAAIGPQYYKDDPDRAPDSVRGCVPLYHQYAYLVLLTDAS